MSSFKFAEMHNVVAFLEKPIESDRFAEIIDFPKASSVHYALTVNLIIYTSCIEQFWATTKVKTVNGVRQLQALIDKKKMIITDSSIGSDLHLEDAEGTDCLPTTTIFEELAKMGYEKPSRKLTFYKAFFSQQWKFFIHTITQCLSAKSTAWNEFSSTMASLIICLATNQKFNLSKYIFDAMLGDMSHHKKIHVNPSHTKKFFANMKRAVKDFSGKITPLFDTMMVQASKEVGEDSDHPIDSNQIPIVDQPSTSSQPKKKQKSKRKQRKEAEVAHDETEHAKSVPTPSNDPIPSGEDSMQLNDLMVLCTQLQKQVLDLEKSKSNQAIKIASLKKRVDKLEKRRKFRTTWLKRLKKVGTTRRIESSNDSLGAQEDASKQGRRIEDIDADVEVTLVNETQERQDEDLMFDTRVLDDDEVFVDVTTTLMEIKAAKPKAKGIVFHDLEKQVSKPTVSFTQPSIKDIGKGIMQKPERPLAEKDQVALDEDLARNLQAQLEAELIEEEMLARKHEEEANIALIKSWDNTQAMMKADFDLAQRLQTEEQGEITIEERSRLFIELMNKRKKHYAMLRAEEKRRKPPTKAQKRNQMSTYLKKHGRVNTFILMDSEEVKSKKGTEESSKGIKDELKSDKSKKAEISNEKAKGSRKKILGKKKAGKEQQQESPKRQKLKDDKETDEHEEVEADDTTELKKHLVIKKDDDIAIDAIPLATKTTSDC
ncbi:hypothetical protein Tco_1490896 [Tanacetum coccineum]